MNCSYSQKIIRWIFLGIEVILYVVFIAIDVFSSDLPKYSEWIKYFSIIVCFLFTVISFELYKNDLKKSMIIKSSIHREKLYDYRLMIIIFIGTLLADWCILLNDYYVLGVVFFSIVQLLYLHRIAMIMKVDFKVNLSAFVIIVIVFRLLGNKIDGLFLVSAFYGVAIGGNALRGIRYLKDHKIKRNKEILFFLGLVLFLFCDINVAIYNVEMYNLANNYLFRQLYGVAKNLIWVFYLPSQVLISLSIPISTIKRKEVHTYGT